MGLELAEQLNWQLPDTIFYPTGGGTGLIGMWKAFDELEEIGWIDQRRPRMVAVQAMGCAPIVKAFDEGKDHAELWQDTRTIASGIRAPPARSAIFSSWMSFARVVGLQLQWMMSPLAMHKPLWRQKMAY